MTSKDTNGMSNRERAKRIVEICSGRITPTGKNVSFPDMIEDELDAACKQAVSEQDETVTETKIYCVNDHANADRLIKWLNSSNRKPANQAFTEGPDRQVAYVTEMSIAKSRRDALEEAAKLAEESNNPWSKELWNHIHKEELPSLASFIADKIRALKEQGE